MIQVSKKDSEPLLTYASLGPTYVSPNTVEGEKEAAIFFPDDYDTVEIVEEEKPRKRKKKRVKGSQGSVSVTTVSGEDESRSIMEELGEEEEQFLETEEDTYDELAALIGGMPPPVELDLIEPPKELEMVEQEALPLEEEAEVKTGEEKGGEEKIGAEEDKATSPMQPEG